MIGTKIKLTSPGGGAPSIASPLLIALVVKRLMALMFLATADILNLYKIFRR